VFGRCLQLLTSRGISAVASLFLGPLGRFLREGFLDPATKFTSEIRDGFVDGWWEGSSDPWKKLE